jgi:hypothetical protein
MSYMLITTAQFPASFPALSHFKKKKKKEKKKDNANTWLEWTQEADFWPFPHKCLFS